MKNESSLTSVQAVRALKRETRAAGVTVKAQAERLGVRPNTVTHHYQRGDMPLSQFLAIAQLAEADPAELLKRKANR